MKVFYSHILLLAFLIGALQPVTPMLQHFLFEGSLTEVLTEQKGDMCESEPCHENKVRCACEHGNEENDELLNIDYYPLTLQMGEHSVPDVLNMETDLCCSGDEQTIALHYQADLPPPRNA